MIRFLTLWLIIGSFATYAVNEQVRYQCGAPLTEKAMLVGMVLMPLTIISQLTSDARIKFSCTTTETVQK